MLRGAVVVGLARSLKLGAAVVLLTVLALPAPAAKAGGPPPTLLEVESDYNEYGPLIYVSGSVYSDRFRYFRVDAEFTPAPTGPYDPYEPISDDGMDYDEDLSCSRGSFTRDRGLDYSSGNGPDSFFSFPIVRKSESCSLSVSVNANTAGTMTVRLYAKLKNKKSIKKNRSLEG